MKKINTVYKAATTLFLEFESDFRVNEKISFYQKCTFIIYYAQLMSILLTNLDSKYIIHQESMYISKCIQLISIYPLLLKMNTLASDILTITITLFLCSILLLTIYCMLHYTNYIHSLKQLIHSIYFIWQHQFLIPITAIACHSLTLRSDTENRYYQFIKIISFINLSLAFLITLLASYFLRQHQFKAQFQIEQYSLQRILINILTYLLILMTYLISSDQYQISYHLIYLFIIALGLNLAITQFSYGFTQIQLLIIFLSFVSIIFELYNICLLNITLLEDQTFFFYFISLPFLYVLSQLIFQNRICYHLCGFITIKSRKKFAKQILNYIFEISQINTQYNVILLHTLFAQHIKICENKNCPIRLNKCYLDSSRQIKIEVIMQFIQFQFIECVTNQSILKQDPQLYEFIAVNYLTFLLNKKNYPLAYKSCQQILHNIEISNNNFVQTFYLSQFTKIIKEFSRQQLSLPNIKSQITKQEQEYQNDIINLYRIEDHYVKSLILQIMQYCDFFNNCYLQRYFSYEEQLNKLKQIYDKNIKLQNLIHNYNSKELGQASIFKLRFLLIWQIVTNYDYEQLLLIAQNIHKIEQSLLETQHQGAFFNNSAFLDDDGITIIGTLMNGHIINIKNKKLNKFLQYDPLYEINVAEQIMPLEFRHFHQGLIDRYLQTGNSAVINQISETYVQNSLGFVQQCEFVLGNYFGHGLQEEYLMIVFVKRLKNLQQNQGVILINKELTIFGITEELYNFIYCEQYLSIQPVTKSPQLKHKSIQELYQTNLREILPECSALIKNNNVDFSQDPQEIYNGFIFNNNVQFSINRKRYYSFFEGDIIENVIYEIIVTHEIKTITSQKIYANFQPSSNRILSPNLNSDFPLSTPHILSEYNDNSKSGQLLNHSNKLNISNLERKQNGSKLIDNKQNIQESSTSRSQQISQLLIIRQINSFNKIINIQSSHFYHFQISSLLVQILLIILSIISLSELFNYKVNLQNECILECQLDINYLNGYTLLLYGINKIMYFKDQYQEQGQFQDYLFEYNSTTFNITKEELLLFSTTIAKEGLLQLEKYQKDYHNMIVKYKSIKQNINLIDYSYNQYNQQIMSRAEFDQIMYASILQTYTIKYLESTDYSSRDQFENIYSRSVIMLNYINKSIMSSIYEANCESDSISKNNEIDALAQILFVIHYFVFIICLLVFSILLRKSLQETKFYLRQFNMLSLHDFGYAFQYYEQLKGLIKIQQICFTHSDFKQIVEIPKNQLDLINNQQHREKESKIRSKKIKKFISIKLIVFLLLLNFIISQCFSMFHQMYYINQSDKITPIFQQALYTERIRLNYLITLQYIELYCQIKFYNAYNNTFNIKLNQSNFYQNLQIFNQINLTQSYLLDRITELQSTKISTFFLKLESQLNVEFDKETMHYFGYHDLCHLTNCDMQDDILSRPYYQDFIEFFDIGIIQLEETVIKILKEQLNLIQFNGSNEDYIQIFNGLQQDSEYFLIYTWGIDALLYQMQQFSKFMQTQGELALDQVSKSVFLIILMTGLLLLLLVICIVSSIIRNLEYNCLVSRQSLKIIPIFLIFERKIINSIISQ